jgi:hypothetical protein
VPHDGASEGSITRDQNRAQPLGEREIRSVVGGEVVSEPEESRDETGVALWDLWIEIQSNPRLESRHVSGPRWRGGVIV